MDAKNRARLAANRLKVKRDTEIARRRLRAGEMWEDIHADGVMMSAIITATASAGGVEPSNPKRCKTCGVKAEVDKRGDCRACKLRANLRRAKIEQGREIPR